MNERSESKGPLSGPRELAGRVAVVTGASSGIGQAIALELAAAGAALFVHGNKNREGASKTERQIQSLRSESTSLLADLSQKEGREKLLHHAWEWKGGVDIWVNNAGADVLTGSDAAEVSFSEKLNQLWQVDVQATIALSRAIGTKMKQDKNRKDPIILNMGWDQAEQGMAGDAGEMFSTIKGAIMAFTKSLAQSLAPDIRVHCLAPGWIKTSWADSANAYWQERAKEESLMQRWGAPEDVAQAVRFLAGPNARFMSGQMIQVNGGFRFGRGG